jgi:hypothetical protein
MVRLQVRAVYEKRSWPRPRRSPACAFEIADQATGARRGILGPGHPSVEPGHSRSASMHPALRMRARSMRAMERRRRVRLGRTITALSMHRSPSAALPGRITWRCRLVVTSPAHRALGIAQAVFPRRLGCVQAWPVAPGPGQCAAVCGAVVGFRRWRARPGSPRPGLRG